MNWTMSCWCLCVQCTTFEKRKLDHERKIEELFWGIEKCGTASGTVVDGKIEYTETEWEDEEEAHLAIISVDSAALAGKLTKEEEEYK